MAYRNALFRFLACVVAFMVVVVIFVHSSRTSLQIERVRHLAAKATQDLESHVIKSSRNRSSATFAEESAREVPTGPDPLHHNANPTRP